MFTKWPCELCVLKNKARLSRVPSEAPKSRRISIASPRWPASKGNINPKGEVSTSNATKQRWDTGGLKRMVPSKRTSVLFDHFLKSKQNDACVYIYIQIEYAHTIYIYIYYYLYVFYIMYSFLTMNGFV